MSNQGSEWNGRLVVFRPNGCNISDDEVKALLDETGASFEDIIFVDDASELIDLDLADTEVLILLDQENCDKPEPEDVARTCSNKGAAVIAVFGQGADYEDVHPIGKKYGTQCTWSADDLLEKIRDPKRAKPTAPSGPKPQREEEKQVKC